MGIRIHKVLGYGIIDLEFDKEKQEITDNRINRDGYLFCDYEDREEKFTLDNFIKYMKDNQKEDRFYNNILNCSIDFMLLKKNIEGIKDNFSGFYNVVIHDWEFGLSNVLVFLPISKIVTWYRYDDVIDYYDDVARRDNLQNSTSHFHIIEHGIWPYETIDGKLVIPFEIEMLCKYLKIFTDDKYINNLKALIYTYWS